MRFSVFGNVFSSCRAGLWKTTIPLQSRTVKQFHHSPTYHRAFQSIQPFQRQIASFSSRSSSHEILLRTAGIVKENPQSASTALVQSMDSSSRKILLATLLEEEANESKKKNVSSAPMPTKRQLWLHGVKAAIPFVGFGFMDNFLMIVLGEGLDATIGVTLGLSTMAAAGLGNLFSDCIGVGTAGTIETFSKTLKIRDPGLTSEQKELPKARASCTWGQIIGCFIGCCIGLIPLAFINSSKREEQKLQKLEARLKGEDPPMWWM